jgi:hypothetical protein
VAITLLLNESDASRRAVPMWLVGSDGTTPATGESNATFFFSIGGIDYGSGGSLSAVSAGGGHYTCNFAASKISVSGPGFVYYRSANALAASTPFEVVPYNSYDSMRLGLFALPNAAAEAAGGLITRGTGAGQLHVSSGSVGLLAQTHSEVTIQGVTRINSNVTIAAATYSDVTVRIAPVNYSGATVGVGNIAAGDYSGVTVEVDNILQSVRSLIADDLLRRDINAGAAGGRSVTDALRPLRNRVLIQGSVLTVYSEDDSTSAWTASVSTVADVVVTGINPAGGSG